MGKQVYQLQQMLHRLLCLINLNPMLLYLNPIQHVISKVSMILQEALNLACKCKRKTIFCRHFTGTQTDHKFHELFHLLDFCIANMHWLLIMGNLDFNSAFNEIFLSLPQILSNYSSVPWAWSCMVTEDKIWALLAKLTSDNGGIVEELMLCLAKQVEAELGELQRNCWTSIMEITDASESNLDLRCKAFKTTFPGAKAIVEQLLRVIKESKEPTLQVLAIKWIGSLARIFYARENHHVIDVLVSQLDNVNQEVETEAVVAFSKFVWEDNYLCKEHSKRMIEFNPIQPLVKLLGDGERTQQVLVLEFICYLALNADYNKATEQARVVIAIEQSLARK